MIKIFVLKKGKKILSVKSSGHSGYDSYGNDIVCAAVSSAIQLTANLITDEFNLPADVKVEDNLIEISIENLMDKIQFENAEKCLSGFIKHMEFISEDYPGTVKIIYTEV